MAQMHHELGAMYHILLEYQYAVWTMRPLKGHSGLEVVSVELTGST